MKFILLFLVFIFSPILSFSKNDNSYDQELLNEINKVVPLSFVDKSEALKNKCVFVPLKSKDIPTCVLDYNGSSFFQEKLIGIYEPDVKGQLKRKEIFAITPHYGQAKVDFVDLLGDGRKFLHIVFEGDTGTYTLQMLEMYAGWNDKEKKFLPVFMENISYELGKTRLLINKKINDQGTNKVSIELTFLHKERRNGNKNYKWVEKFHWNQKNYSFYREEDEKEKIKIPISPLQKCLGGVRLKFLEKRPDLTNLDVGALNAIGVMDCI